MEMKRIKSPFEQTECANFTTDSYKFRLAKPLNLIFVSADCHVQIFTF